LATQRCSCIMALQLAPLTPEALFAYSQSSGVILFREPYETRGVGAAGPSSRIKRLVCTYAVRY
jgi:hypothetical protein